jgi:hypothetical protein
MEEAVMDIRDPAGIERELERRVLAASGTGTRASMFNLVVVHRLAEAGPVEPALEGMMGKRPARIVRVESGNAGPSRVFVSARCATGTPERAVCFEEIVIQDGEDGLGRDPGYWTPLLIRHLPVYLWWLEETGPLAGDAARLREVADRLLVDTGFREERGEEPYAALGRLAVLAGSSLDLSDFSWQRVLPLRRWTARLFDPPENRARLERIEGVSLDGGRRSEALLLFLWLASRLGWRPERPEGARIPEGGSARFLDRSGQPVTLEHRGGSRPPAEPLSGTPVPHGALAPHGSASLSPHVALSPRGDLRPGSGGTRLSDGFRLEFRIRGETPLAIRCGENGCAFLERPGAEEQAIRLQIPDDTQILIAEVDARRADPLLREALRVLERPPHG